MYLPAGSTITLRVKIETYEFWKTVTMGDSGDSNLVIHPHFTNLIFNEVWDFSTLIF